jgi:hypothetical protein
MHMKDYRHTSRPNHRSKPISPPLRAFPYQGPFPIPPANPIIDGKLLHGRPAKRNPPLRREGIQSHRTWAILPNVLGFLPSFLRQPGRFLFFVFLLRRNFLRHVPSKVAMIPTAVKPVLPVHEIALRIIPSRPARPVFENSAFEAVAVCPESSLSPKIEGILA